LRANRRLHGLVERAERRRHSAGRRLSLSLKPAFSSPDLKTLFTMFILPMIIILQIEEFPYSFFADVVLINLIKKLNFLLIKDKYKCLPTSAFSFLIEYWN
jgi:hypothetical protein